MFVEIIKNMELNGTQKTILTSMAQLYENNLPQSLSMNHYELADEFGFTPVQWNEFLKNEKINHLIETEIATIAEIGARKALDRLQSGKAASADIQAAKEILSNAKLLKQKMNPRQHVVITRISKPS